MAFFFFFGNHLKEKKKKKAIRDIIAPSRLLAQYMS